MGSWFLGACRCSSSHLEELKHILRMLAAGRNGSNFFLGQVYKLRPSKWSDCHICNSDKKHVLFEPAQFPIFHTASLIRETATHPGTWSFIHALLFFFMPIIINIYRVLTMCLTNKVPTDLISFNLLKKCPSFHSADEECEAQGGSVTRRMTESEFEAKSLWHSSCPLNHTPCQGWQVTFSNLCSFRLAESPAIRVWFPLTSRISISWEHVTNAKPQGPTHTRQIQNLHFHKMPRKGRADTLKLEKLWPRSSST